MYFRAIRQEHKTLNGVMKQQLLTEVVEQLPCGLWGTLFDGIVMHSCKSFTLEGISNGAIFTTL